jgi:hypothetical protein
VRRSRLSGKALDRIEKLEALPEAAIRFSVGDGQSRRAATWKCWTARGLGKNDVYLACRELRGALKASLHQSGQWHVAFDGSFLERNAVAEEWPTRFVTTWDRPAELTRGLTLACRIITPFATVSATMLPEPGSEIVWIPPPPEGHAAETVVIIATADASTDGWPGKRSMGTQFVGRLQLDNADTVWIVTRVVPLRNFETKLNHARFFHGRTKADVKGPGLRGIAFGAEADGSRVMYEIVAKEDAWTGSDDHESGVKAV